MSAFANQELCIVREIVWSLVAGLAITLLLAVLGALHILPGMAYALLRPGLFLLGARHDKYALNRVALALVDGIIYGLLSFVVMHLRWRRQRLLKRTPYRVERRRACRVALATPVFVYGWTKDEPFSESTETLNVSATGGLLPLSAKVTCSQDLILTNLKTNQDLRCRVVRSAVAKDGEILAGLTFRQASPRFWQIDFVPKDDIPLSKPRS